MTVKELIAKLAEMPQNAEVEIAAYDIDDTLIINDFCTAVKTDEGNVRLRGY